MNRQHPYSMTRHLTRCLLGLLCATYCATSSVSASTDDETTDTTDGAPPVTEAGVDDTADLAGLPSCEHLLQEAPILAGSPQLGAPGPGSLLAAKASSDGYALLSIVSADLRSRVVDRALRLVGSPRRRTDENLQRLLPRQDVGATRLSEIRAGRVLASQEDWQAEPTITLLDLDRRSAVWSRTLRAHSGAPPPADETGAASQGAGLLQRVHHLELYEDGRYTVLAATADELVLLGFDALGSATFRATVMPSLETHYDEPAAARRAEGTLAIALSMDSSEREAFELFHGKRFIQDNGNTGALVLFSPEGKLLSVQETVLPPGDGFKLSGLTVSPDRWTWFVKRWNMPTLLMASFGSGDSSVRITPSALRTDRDALLSFTSLAGQLYVTGLLDAHNVIKTLWTGTPFIARMSPDGTLTDRCVLHTGGDNTMPTYTLISGEVPLLMITHGRDFSMFTQVYRLQALKL